MREDSESTRVKKGGREKKGGTKEHGGRRVKQEVEMEGEGCKGSTRGTEVGERQRVVSRGRGSRVKKECGLMGYAGLDGTSSRLYCIKQQLSQNTCPMCILAQKEGSECASIRYLESGGVMKFKSTEHKERDC